MKHVIVRGRVHVASGPYAYILISTHSPVFNSLDLDIIPFLLREKKEHSRNVPALSNSTIETQFRHRDGTFAYTFLLVGGDALLVDFSEFVMNTVNMR